VPGPVALPTEKSFKNLRFSRAVIAPSKAVAEGVMGRCPTSASNSLPSGGYMAMFSPSALAYGSCFGVVLGVQVRVPRGSRGSGAVVL